MSRLALSVVLLFCVTSAGDWVTGGGNPWRSGLSDECGPASRGDLAWQGTVSGIFGAPIYIWDTVLVTMRFQTINYAPIVCHDLVTGETLWTHDFPGTNSRSLPIGLRDGRVYAINFQESQHDTLYALDAGYRRDTLARRGAGLDEHHRERDLCRGRRPHRHRVRLQARAGRLRNRRHGLDHLSRLAGHRFGRRLRVRQHRVRVHRRHRQPVRQRVGPRDRPLEVQDAPR